MALSIAAGQTLEDELNAFMYSIGSLLANVPKESMEPHWFMGGMMTIAQMYMSNIFFIRTETTSTSTVEGAQRCVSGRCARGR